MLGRVAGGLFWMFRALERSENIARLVEAGFRFALTHSTPEHEEWSSVVGTSGQRDAYLARHDDFDGVNAVAFLLRETDNPSSILSLTHQARDNARMVRTALTREVWEAVNESWLEITQALSQRVSDRDLPAVLGLIRRRSALVRGAMHGTMMRTDAFDFARLGTFVERADSTARILDVKYHLLLPSVAHVGSTLDNVQWEAILDSVAARGAFRRLHSGDLAPRAIADFLIHDGRLPRSLAFCTSKIVDNLGYLAGSHGERRSSNDAADRQATMLQETPIEKVFATGLHEFIEAFIASNNALASAIQTDYRFQA